MEIKVGSVVKLKSDSPNMTVTYISTGGNATCQYYFNGEVRFAEIPVEALTVIRS